MSFRADPRREPSSRPERHLWTLHKYGQTIEAWMREIDGVGMEFRVYYRNEPKLGQFLPNGGDVDAAVVKWRRKFEAQGWSEQGRSGSGTPGEPAPSGPSASAVRVDPTASDGTETDRLTETEGNYEYTVAAYPARVGDVDVFVSRVIELRRIFCEPEEDFDPNSITAVARSDTAYKANQRMVAHVSAWVRKRPDFHDELEDLFDLWDEEAEEKEIDFRCPECGAAVFTGDATKAWALSTWICPNGDWTGKYPCGPCGHEEGHTLDTTGRCRFCLRPMPADDGE